jgi:CheY-like chemotaxis protein
MRILIIDDCPINRNILLKYFSVYGSCDTAENGQDGFDAVINAIDDNKPYDLISLDISMPGLSGFDTLKAIRNAEKERDISDENMVKILIVTAFSDEESVLKTYNDCQGYLFKPIRFAKLKQKLAQLNIYPEKGSSFIPETPSPQKQKTEYADMIPEIFKSSNKLMFRVRNHEDKETVVDSPDKLNFFNNVISGQLVAKISGKNTLKAGHGIHYREQEQCFIANRTGKAVFEKDTISIQETMILKGPLRLQNIDFLGKVEVHGDIIDDSKIKATKGIRVTGTIDGCKLISESDIHVNRINGANKAVIKCGGNFQAEFVYGAVVECRKDADIKVECVNSVIKSSRNIHVGTVTGGECTALKSIQANRAGSPKDVSTLLKVGVNFYKEDRKQLLTEKINEIDLRLADIATLLGPAGKPSFDLNGITESRRKKIQHFLSERQNLKESQEDLQEEIILLDKADAQEENKPEIRINDILYKGVRLEIDEDSKLISKDIRGPLKISDNLKRL